MALRRLLTARLLDRATTPAKGGPWTGARGAHALAADAAPDSGPRPRPAAPQTQHSTQADGAASDTQPKRRWFPRRSVATQKGAGTDSGDPSSSGRASTQARTGNSTKNKARATVEEYAPAPVVDPNASDRPLWGRRRRPGEFRPQWSGHRPQWNNGERQGWRPRTQDGDGTTNGWQQRQGNRNWTGPRDSSAPREWNGGERQGWRPHTQQQEGGTTANGATWPRRQWNGDRQWTPARPRHDGDGGAPPPADRQHRWREAAHSTGHPENRWREGGGHQWQRGSAEAETPAAAPKPAAKKKPVAPAPPPPPREIDVPAGVTVRDLARLLDVDVARLESVLASVDAAPASEEDAVDADAAELAALELGVSAVVARPPPIDAAPRPPIVAVMGHVDHGKTTLLDALRDTAVAASEAGGITQAVGAFEVRMPGSDATITFLDTPGHAAFTAMRARGAAGADIAVLVVDARDGVKPQTREAMAHAAAARVPIVVAITKCDLPDADPEVVRRQLMAEGLGLEVAGGTVQCVDVAARARLGLTDLEDALLLQADTMALSASPTAPATGVVVEARIDKGIGPVATVIVRDGTLRAGDAVVVGAEWGRVRSLTSPGGGGAIDAARPGQPVEVSGLRGVPAAGDALAVAPTEERARRLAAARATRAASARHDVSAAAVAAATAAAEEDSDGDGKGDDAPPTRIVLLVKADTHGAVEAASAAFASLSTPAVPITVAASGVGPVTASDVQHAAAVGATVVAYGVRAGGAAVEREARKLGVPLTAHRVIYALMDSVAALAAGATPAAAVDTIAGTAEIVQVFPLGGRGAAGVVAGVRVVDGVLTKAATFRVKRGGAVVWEGGAASLRRHKLDVDRVGAGAECGVLLDGYDGVQAGDVLEAVTVEYVATTAESVLEGSPASGEK